MKKILLASTLLFITASAHAGTYHFEGVTVSVADGCRSSSCVSVNAPGYGSYNGKAAAARRSAKATKIRKDETRFASTTKPDAAPVATEAAPVKQTDPAQAAAPAK